MKTVSAIIVAAGSGRRMGAEEPKQFIKIKQKTILQHTLDRFVSFNLFDEIIIVLAPEYVSLVEPILNTYENKNIKTCIGGKERFHSVQNALQTVNPKSEMVFIHDAVRPFCSTDLANLCYAECKKHGSAIPSIPLKDSIRKINKSGESEIVNRTDLRSIQTPQVFDFAKIKDAYNVDYSETFTDDASVYEAAKNKIHLVKGESTNIKLTTPDDLEFARLWL